MIDSGDWILSQDQERHLRRQNKLIQMTLDNVMRHEDSFSFNAKICFSIQTWKKNDRISASVLIIINVICDQMNRITFSLNNAIIIARSNIFSLRFRSNRMKTLCLIYFDQIFILFFCPFSFDCLYIIASEGVFVIK